MIRFSISTTRAAIAMSLADVVADLFLWSVLRDEMDREVEG
jgi:hypothetical protein